MVYPIVLYGNAILRTVAQPITNAYPNLAPIIANMWDTMYATKGVGLAAPQIDHSIRLFVIDSDQMFRDDPALANEYPDAPGVKQIFINPKIIDAAGDLWGYEEGCLSFPYLKTIIQRQQHLTIQYQDENFVQHTASFSGITARIIFHEYDHLEGKLFIDKASPLKKKLFASRLSEIQKGKVQAFYKTTM